MYPSVIHIYGASGSGTTTLGKFISEQLGYTFMDTQMIISGSKRILSTHKKEK